MGTNSAARIAPLFLRGRTIRAILNWRWDLNQAFFDGEGISGNSPESSFNRTL
jgi:hypothetical protein